MSPSSQGDPPLEEPCRLSRSPLWKLQRAFFEQRGVEAWSRGTVPHFITSNPFVAGAYARVVRGFLRDCLASSSIDRGEPLYVVEVGSGSGRFGYHFLRALRGSAILEGIDLRFVMTDLGDKGLDFLRAHPKLRALADEGILELARFDAERDGELRLERSGMVLAPATVTNPMVVVANYVFDGLPQDAYYVREGRLYESLSRLTRAPGGEALADDDPALLEHLVLSYERRLLEDDAALDEDVRPLLEEYAASLGRTAVEIPVASIACLRTLRRLCRGPVLVLSADKGHHREEDLLERSEPGLVVHGSFSMPVNYHALGRYVERAGGEALHPTHRHDDLCVSAFLFGAPSGGVETREAYRDAIDSFGPDDYFSLKKAIERYRGELGIEPLLACCRLAGYDGKVLLDLLDVLVSRAPSASDAHKRELRAIARRAWDLHYPIGEARDLASGLGTLMRVVGYFPEAIEYLERSAALSGPSAHVSYELALCHVGLRRMQAALDLLEEALAAAPAFEDARTMRIWVRAELARA